MIEIDDSQVVDMFNALEPEKRKAILFNAIKKGAKVLQDNTKAQLRNTLGESATRVSGRNRQSMESGVKLRADKAYCDVNVHIMGDYRLKWFETGTALRQTKKGQNRGYIAARNFFASARSDESGITEAINQSITEQLRKI